MSAIETKGFELVEWQRAAVDSWATGDSHPGTGERRPFTGTLEIFTGGGKTLLALTAIARASVEAPGLRVAVVVPTEALAHQWMRSIDRYTTVDQGQIGLMGAGGHGDLARYRVLVCVLNSAAKLLPAMAGAAQPLMLVVDECHRAGAPSYSQVLDTRASYRLGLSATPDREEFGDDGEPLLYDEQKVGRSLGGVVARFSLKDARTIGWLPEYEIHHHGLTLHEDERHEYESISRQVDDMADHLRQMGIDTSRAHSLQAQPGEVGDAVRAYVAATSRRKDFLYRARERSRVAARVVARSMRGGRTRRVLLFHERVAQAVELHRELQVLLPDTEIALEHSKLPQRERARALARFRTGEAPVLVSVKSLIEGIDVPEADVGVSVASSASVRQRIQALGRVLRRTFDDTAERKVAEMHVLYVANSVDELIYAREDWGDLTGDAQNTFWLWPLDPEAQPDKQDGPPATPRPTEEQEWIRLGEQAPTEPVLWEAAFAGQEYSVDTLGTVKNELGTTIANPQGVDRMVETVRGRPGGRFRVTREHQLVLVAREGKERTEVLVAGQLLEPFTARPELEQSATDDLDITVLQPGDAYPGPGDSDGGTFHLRLKRGGIIERKVKGGAEFAFTHGTASPDLEANATRLLAAWKTVLDRGITFHINGLGHAWYEAEGERRFLADVPGGFAWPED